MTKDFEKCYRCDSYKDEVSALESQLSLAKDVIENVKEDLEYISTHESLIPKINPGCDSCIQTSKDSLLEISKWRESCGK